MSVCPTCGHVSQRGTQADASAVRVVVCWACRQPFTQFGPGRRRITCRDPRCMAKRSDYRKKGLAALDRMP